MIVGLSKATGENAGAKAAVLGELLRAGFPVPPGFVVTTAAYRAVVDGLDLPAEARLIASQPLPVGLARELADAVSALGGAALAVRSSASTEDTFAGSAAGQHDSFLGLSGPGVVAERVMATWASLWSDRAVAYRASGAVGVEPEMGVIVQRHVDAEVAGVLFTGSTTVIEAAWGLGESVVQGLVTPDSYVVAVDGSLGGEWTVTSRRVGDKRSRRDRGVGGIGSSLVPDADRGRFCLDDRQLLRLVRLGQQVAEQLGGSRDIEFAIEEDVIWVLQARPVTAPLPPERAAAGRTGSLRGTPGSPGAASGPARVVRGPGDFARVEAGDILVCRFTDPAWTPLFGVAAGIVTETGGVLSHAAIVAREHRIPAVLGVPIGAIRDGQPLIVDGTNGTVS